MKVILAVLATAAVLSGAAVASNVTPMQITALSKKVDVLNKRLAADERKYAWQSDVNGVMKRVAALERRQSYFDKCLTTFTAVRQYTGYLFVDDQGVESRFSALDFGDGKSTADLWVVSGPASCASSTP
jgi:hypothetical protein